RDRGTPGRPGPTARVRDRDRVRRARHRHRDAPGPAPAELRSARAWAAPGARVGAGDRADADAGRAPDRGARRRLDRGDPGRIDRGSRRAHLRAARRRGVGVDRDRWRSRAAGRPTLDSRHRVTRGILAGMATRDQMRAADGDRERVAERVRQALDEGRRTLDGLAERLRQVYQAKTFGELGRSVAALPPLATPAESQLTPAAKPLPSRIEANPKLPTWLSYLWRLWLV